VHSSGGSAACQARHPACMAARAHGESCVCSWAAALFPQEARAPGSGPLPADLAGNHAPSRPSCRRRSTALISAGWCADASGDTSSARCYAAHGVLVSLITRTSRDHRGTYRVLTHSVQNWEVQGPAAMQVGARLQQGGGLPQVAAGPLRGSNLPTPTPAAARSDACLHLLPSGAQQTLVLLNVADTCSCACLMVTDIADTSFAAHHPLSTSCPACAGCVQQDGLSLPACKAGPRCTCLRGVPARLVPQWRGMPAEAPDAGDGAAAAATARPATWRPGDGWMTVQGLIWLTS
jgi:hypothetical protein